MSRVKGVVGNSIMVSIEDVVAGDILCHSNSEKDPIISKVEKCVVEGKLKIRFWYVPRQGNYFHCSMWMDQAAVSWGSGIVFIHDLKRERFEFDGVEINVDQLFRRTE